MNNKSSLVSIIIVNYNGKKYLEKCLRSVLNTKYENFEIIVVDNGSTDRSVEYIKNVFKKNSKIKIIQNKENVGPALARNIGIKKSKGKYVAFLDNDTVTDKHWLNEPIELMENDATIGACQCKLLLMDDPKRFDYAGEYLTQYGFLIPRVKFGAIDRGQADSVKEILGAKSAATIANKKILTEIGLFDKDYFIYTEETDLCWRVWLRGYRVIFAPNSRVYHRFSASMNVLADQQKYLLRFHGTKNYITTLIKNLGLKNLLKILPKHVILWVCLAIWFYVKGRKKESKFIMQGIFWNISSLKKILEKRAVTQKTRRVSDSELMPKIMKKQKLHFLLNRFMKGIQHQKVLERRV